MLTLCRCQTRLTLETQSGGSLVVVVVRRSAVGILSIRSSPGQAPQLSSWLGGRQRQAGPITADLDAIPEWRRYHRPQGHLLLSRLLGGVTA